MTDAYSSASVWAQCAGASVILAGASGAGLLKIPGGSRKKAGPQATLQPLTVVFKFVVYGAVNLLVGYTGQASSLELLLWWTPWP